MKTPLEQLPLVADYRGPINPAILPKKQHITIDASISQSEGLYTNQSNSALVLAHLVLHRPLTNFAGTSSTWRRFVVA